MGDSGLLSNAIRMLVDKFPTLPPSDSWKYIDPQLAAIIHLRYLDAYDHNQKLLLHLCDKQRSKGGFASSSYLDKPIGLYDQPSSPKNSDASNVGDVVPYNTHQEMVPYNQINNSYARIGNNRDSIPALLPFSIHNNYAQPTLSIPMNNDSSGNSSPPYKGKSPKSGIQGVTFNKYKNSWCVSLVDADGLRRRRFFNVRKYGFDGARSLALEFLMEYHQKNLSTQVLVRADVAFDRKERNLIQDILFKCDMDDIDCVDIEEAQDYSERFREEFSNICGLVFIPGILIFTTIAYDSSGKRVITKFPIKNSTFEDAVKAAMGALQKAHKRSKICGILPFHSDKNFIYATCYDLKLDVSKSFSLKGGFVTAHKEAIAFRRGVLNGMKKKGEPSVSGVIKFPGVYYDSYSKCWVSSCSYSGVRKEVKFYIKKHGEICARELAIRHRMGWMKNRR